MKSVLKFFFLPAILFALFSLSGAAEANAATIYFSPSSGNFSVGNILTTSVFVNTQELAINNTDAVLNFPAALLEVVSVSKSGSIFSLWVEEPNFSNSAGTVSFNGGLPTPGYTGTAGKVVSIVFRVKAAGSASLIFSSAAVRANDGYGTDVLQSRGQAQFTLKAVETPPAVPPAEAPPAEAPPAEAPPTTGAPFAPKISSSTNPNPDEWYSNNDLKFVWGLPKGLTGVSIAFDKLPTTNPGTRSDGLFAESTYPDVDDGISYFHARIANSKGWSPVTHYRVQIDTKQPETFTATVDIKTGATSLKAKTTDATSGIAYYTVKIDSLDPVKADTAQLEAGAYVLGNLTIGKHSVQVVAFDKAGNSTSATAEFAVDSPQAPIFTDYPTVLTDGDILTLKGTTQPNALLSIWLQRDSGEIHRYSVQANENGAFVFTGVDRVKSGSYQAWAEAVTEQGYRTDVSTPILINVKQAIVLKTLDKYKIHLAIYASVISLLTALVTLIRRRIFKGWWILLTTSLLSRRLRRQPIIMSILHDDILAYLKLLDKVRRKRQLTPEEEKIASGLKKDLNLAEKTLKNKK